MIDLTELKDSLDVEVVFRLNEPKEYVGVLEDGNNALEKIKLVLTQTFDALDIPPFKQFIITFGSDGSLILDREGALGGESLGFDFDSIDELIVSVTNALGVSIDKKRLSPSPRSVGSLDLFNSGDVIEGR